MAMQHEGVDQVDPDEAERLVDAGAVLLDVREQDEWTAGRAPGAIHLPMARVPEEHDDVLDVDRRVVVMCRSGARSQRVATFLRSSGYDAVNAAGGMQAWQASGRPVVADGARPGSVA